MYRDTSELPTNADCYSIRDDKTLLVTTDTTQVTYNLISDKWTWTRSEPVPSLPSGNGTACQTLTQIQQIPSYYDFMTPIYWNMAIVSALLLFYFAWRLIIHPFYRNKA